MKKKKIKGKITITHENIKVIRIEDMVLQSKIEEKDS